MSDSNWIKTKAGDRVVSSRGLLVGKVKSARNNQIEVDHARLRLPDTAVVERQGKIVRLGQDYDVLVDSPSERKSGGGALKWLGMVAAGGAIAAGILAVRMKGRQQAQPEAHRPSYPYPQGYAGNATLTNGGSASQTTATLNAHAEQPSPASRASTPASQTPVTAPVTESARQSEEPQTEEATVTTPEAIEESAGGTDLPSFATLDLSDRVITETEQDVVELVSRAFPERTLSVNAVGVHKLDGGEAGTLRFTLDEVASTDLLLERLETSRESASSLALEVIEALQTQLPAEPA